MQKHTLKLLLRKDKANKDGLCPIALRLIVDRKQKYFSTGYYIHPDQWDSVGECVKNHPLKDLMNTDILAKKRDVLNKVVNDSVAGRKVTADSIKEKVLSDDIFAFYNMISREIAHKRSEATLENWRKHLLKLEEFIGKRELKFDDVTTATLSKFETYLVKTVNKRKDTSNYRYAILKTIRSLFYAAKRRGITDNYPFAVYEMPKQTAGDKEYLTDKELAGWYKNVETLPLHLRSSAIWFLFGCYTGLRISDWLVFDLQKRVLEDCIQVRPAKNITRGNKWVVLPRFRQLDEVLELCGRYPIEEGEKSINRKLKDISVAFNINKTLSSHCARRTFAVTRCLGHGISPINAAEFMGITLGVFMHNYAAVTPDQLKKDAVLAWGG